MLETGILGSKLRRRLLGFVLGAVVGFAVLVFPAKRTEKSPPVFKKDAYSLPLFIQCTPPEACDGASRP